MSSKGQTTTKHDEIRRWAKARGGRPMVVQGTQRNGSQMIRLAFPDAPNSETENLEPVSWDEWFRQFEQNDLALLMEETTSDGQQSLFNKLVSR